MGDFFERTELIAEMVGDGALHGHFSVNRVYAAVQHEAGWMNYMGTEGPKEIKVYHRGGGAKFVEGPLLANYERYYQDLADAVLKGELIPVMIANLTDQDENLQWAAPEESGALKRSGSTAVVDNGNLVHYKPPEVPYEDE